jgi:hypothetical protein
VFRGILLNEPYELESVSGGSEILFLVPTSGEYPLHVTQRYLDDRDAWRTIQPCDNCGLSELLSSGVELHQHTFPDAGSSDTQGVTFTTKCGVCGGRQLLRLKRKRSNQ